MPRSPRFWKILVALIFAATILYLLGARRVPLWDRDEPRYAECSREMLQTGEWVVPKYLGNWRIEKPPFIYWSQMAVMSIIGDNSEAARFPSTVAVVLTTLLLGLVVRHFLGDRRALWTIFIFCTSILTIASAKFCITDAVMMFFVAMGQACLAFLYWSSRRNKKSPAWAAPIFWISLGLAGLTKGPQALGMHCVTLLLLLTLDAASNNWNWRQSAKWWMRLQPLVGLPILAIVVTPWLVLVHQRAPGFVQELFHKARLHTATSMEGHGEPPGYHLALIIFTFFPWSLLLPTAVTSAWRHRNLPTIRFAMAATAGPWLLMELVRTKLPFYILPAFPGLAFLTADTLVRCIRGQNRDLKRPIFRVGVAVWAGAILVLAFAPWLFLLASKPAELPIPAFIAFTLGGIIYASLVFARFYENRFARAAIVLGGGMAIMVSILYINVFPKLDLIQLSERIADDLTQLGGYGSNVRVAMIGYAEPSLAFYQGGGAREQISGYLQTTPQSEWPKWIVVSIQEWETVPPDVQHELKIRAIETGFNYSHAGRNEKVLILENPKG